MKLITLGFMTDLDNPVECLPDLSEEGLFLTEVSVNIKDLGDKYYCETCGQQLNAAEAAASLNSYKHYGPGCCPFLCNQCCSLV